MADTTSALNFGMNASYGSGGYMNNTNSTSALTGITNNILPTILPQQQASNPQGGIGYNISGGSGFSGVGAGVGALVTGGNPVGAVVGSGIGSLADIAINLMSGAQQRREQRRERRRQELIRHRNALATQRINAENMAMNKESHAMNMAMNEVSLESAKMNLADQKNQKMVQLVKSYFGNNARRLDPLTGSLT